MPNHLISPLADLRHHWGEAYLIHGIIGHWRAQRRDDRRTLTAEDPETLREVIRTDYARKPVPRTPPAAGVAEVETQGSTL